MTVSCLFLVCLPRYSFTWFQLLASGLLDCGAGFTLSLSFFSPCSHRFAVATAYMACLFAATTTGKAVKDEQQQMLQLAAGWAGVVGRLPSNHLVSLQNCDAWCRCQSSVHHGRKVLQHEFVNTFGFVARVDSLCFICFPQRVR